MKKRRSATPGEAAAGKCSVMSTEDQMLEELESLSEFRKVNAQFPYNDYVRKWQLVDWVMFGENNLGRPIPAIFLDLVRQVGAKTNGILIPISEEELNKMDKRERNYDRVNVSNLIEPNMSEHIYTYFGKKEHTSPPKESCVLIEYEKIIEEGFNFWSKAFKQHYYESTISHQFPLKKGNTLKNEEFSGQQVSMKIKGKH